MFESAMRRPYTSVRVVRLHFDRPFGFVAIDRPSGLVLMAGWVDDPAPYVEVEFRIPFDR